MPSNLIPTGLGGASGPFNIELTDCMGDSVSVINANTNYLASFTAAVSSRVNNLETRVNEISAALVPTIITRINSTTEINILFDPTSSIPTALRSTLTRLRDHYLKAAILPFYNNDESLYNSRVTIKNYPVVGSLPDSERFLRVLTQNEVSPSSTSVINICIQDEAGGEYTPTDNAFNPTSARMADYNADIGPFRVYLNSLTKPFYVEMITVGGTSAVASRNFSEFIYSIKNGIGEYAGTFGLSDYPNLNATYDHDANESASYYTELIINILKRLN